MGFNFSEVAELNCLDCIPQTNLSTKIVTPFFTSSLKRHEVVRDILLLKRAAAQRCRRGRTKWLDSRVSTVIDMAGVFGEEAAIHVLSHLKRAVVQFGRLLQSRTSAQEPCWPLTRTSHVLAPTAGAEGDIANEDGMNSSCSTPVLVDPPQ